MPRGFNGNQQGNFHGNFITERQWARIVRHAGGFDQPCARAVNQTQRSVSGWARRRRQYKPCGKAVSRRQAYFVSGSYVDGGAHPGQYCSANAPRMVTWLSRVCALTLRAVSRAHQAGRFGPARRVHGTPPPGGHQVCLSESCAQRHAPPALALLAQCAGALILRTGWSDHVPQAHGRVCFSTRKEICHELLSASSGRALPARLLLCCLSRVWPNCRWGLCWPALLCSGRAILSLAAPCTIVSPLATGVWSLERGAAVPAAVCLAAPARQAGALWAARWLILALALTGVTACNTLIYQGLQSTPATQAVLLNAFTPVMVLIYAVCSGQRQPARGQWLGLALSLVGCWCWSARARRGDCRRSPQRRRCLGVRRLRLLGGLHRADAPSAHRAGSAGAHRCLHAAGLVAADAAGVVGYQSAWPAQRVASGAGRRAVSGRVSIGGGVSVLQPGDCRAGRRACQRLPVRSGASLWCAIVLPLLLGETHPGMCWALRRCLPAWRWGVRRAERGSKTCLACLRGLAVLFVRSVAAHLSWALARDVVRHAKFENLHASAV